MAQTENVVNIDPQGRIVIPARARRALGLRDGTSLAVRVDGGRLILEPRAEVLRRMRGRYAGRAGRTSLSRELIADRREEARRESRR